MSNRQRKTAKELLRAKKTRSEQIVLILDQDAHDGLLEARHNAKRASSALEAAEATLNTAGTDPLVLPGKETSLSATPKADSAIADRFRKQEQASARALTNAKKAAIASTVTLTFEGVGRIRLGEVLAENQPTEEQTTKFAAEAEAAGKPKVQWIGPEFNPDTYPRAITLVSLVGMTAGNSKTVETIDSGEEFDELIWGNTAYSEADLHAMYVGALSANNKTAADLTR